MSHEIFGDRFIGRDAPAWHQLGTVFTKAIGAVDAFEMAGLDYEVQKYPMIGIRVLEDGTMDPMSSNKFGLWRDPTPDSDEYRFTGGIVSEDFTVVQNMDLARMVEPFTAEWPVETVAALKHGSVVFITLNVGDFDIAGEQHTHYLAINNGHDGSRSLSIDLSDVRRVCWNTLIYGESRAEVNIKLKHTKNVLVEAEWYTQQILAIRAGITRQEEQMKRMAEVKLNSAGFREYVADVFPVADGLGSKKSQFIEKAMDVASEEDLAKLKAANDTEQDRYTRMLEWTELQREASFERYASMQTAIAGTVYGGYQAINEVTNWRRGANAEESLVLPGGARNVELSRAWDKAVALIS